MHPRGVKLENVRLGKDMGTASTACCLFDAYSCTTAFSLEDPMFRDHVMLWYLIVVANAIDQYHV